MMVNGKKAQVTLFIIFALILVTGVAGFFIYKGVFSTTNTPSTIQPVYSAYTSCITNLAEEGIAILGSRGGYIDTPEFEPGSPFMPTSSQLDFLGTPIPYWYYVSGNNIAKEQIPSKKSMELALQDYIQENLQSCDLQEYEERGYLVDVDKGTVDVRIEDNQIIVDVENDVRVLFEDNFFTFNDHRIVVKSKLGKFYNLAESIYKKDKSELFLANYALDVLSLNAPTSGFEEGCSPIVFNFAEIRRNVSEAFRENLAFVKVKGSYYSNSDPYFVVDLGSKVNENVNFIYSTQWPTKIEIYGKDVAEPVGLQPGMELLGFCFVEYQFIYDLAFPVLIQISDEKELFQFPVVVLVERNQIKKDLPIGEYYSQNEVVCKNRNNEIAVRTINSDGVQIPSSLSFSCLGERCYLGESTNTLSSGIVKVPSCVNGFIEASAEGYATNRYMISSNEVKSADIIMKKIYTLNLDLGNIPGEALITFRSDDFSRSVYYPNEKKIQLVEGDYEVSVQVYRNSSLVFPGRVEKRCFDSASSGISGLLGQTESNCYDINIPSQQIDRTLAGGGSAFVLVDEELLKNSNTVDIDVPLFPTPSKIEDLNNNFIKLEDSFILVNFL